MPTTGPNNVTSGTNDASIGTVPWANPSNITADDLTFSTFTPAGSNTISQYLKGLNPAFTVPLTATITSVSASIPRLWNGTGAMADSTVSLFVGGAAVGPNKAVGGSWPTSKTTEIYTWSIPGDVSLTPAQANASNFGAAISVIGSSALALASVDSIQISVTYVDGAVRRTESRSVMTRGILQGETDSARRRLFFDVRDTTGLTAAPAEASGQPVISINGGQWQSTGIGTLTAIVPSTRGRYFADLTAAVVSGANIDDVIETSYKSGNTVETPGDIALIKPRTFIEGNVLEATPGRVRIHPIPSRTDNEYRGQLMLAVTGVNSGLCHKVTRYIGGTADFYFEGGSGDTDNVWNTALQSGDAVMILGRSL